MRRSLPILLCSLALAGCAPIPEGASADYPGSDGTSATTAATTAGSPTNYTPPTNPLNNGATYSGIYNANALLDFTQKGVLPGLESPACSRSPSSAPTPAPRSSASRRPRVPSTSTPPRARSSRRSSRSRSRTSFRRTCRPRSTSSRTSR